LQPDSEADSEGSDTNEDREAVLQVGEMKKPPKKKARCDDDTGEADSEAANNLKLPPRTRIWSSQGILSQRNVNVDDLLRPLKRRPLYYLLSLWSFGSPPFNASVFVSVEQPPQLVRGRTHRTDKHVVQERRVAA
jgi:hypothetical protein